MSDSGERIVDGKASGLLGLNEEVTWEARHFGFLHRHRSRITALDRPRHFRDEMVSGRFSSFAHDHFFEARDSGTLMIDVVDFRAPLGPLGRLVDRLFLATYLARILRRRNAVIKEEAEASHAS